MPERYHYYKYENLPCRAETKTLGIMEIYKSGAGFVEAPKMTIISEGTPISKAEFDALVLAIVRKSKASI